MDKRQLGALIRAAREAKGLSMKELGKLVHNSKTTVQNWEMGDSLPRPDTLALLVSELDLPSDILQRLATKRGHEPVYPSLVTFLREHGGEVSDAEREWLQSQRFVSGDPGDVGGWWASQLLAYRRLQRDRESAANAGAGGGSADFASQWLAAIVAREAKRGLLRPTVRERLLAMRHNAAEITDVHAALDAAIAEDAFEHPEDHGLSPSRTTSGRGAGSRGSKPKAAAQKRVTKRR